MKALESLGAVFSASPILKCSMRINAGYVKSYCKYGEKKKDTEDILFSFKSLLRSRDIYLI